MVTVLALVGCGRAEPRKTTPEPHHEVLRVIYRDARTIMLLALPVKAGDRVPVACAQPLLIDPATGAVRTIPPAEAASRLKTMQLSGATQGTCPTDRDSS